MEFQRALDLLRVEHPGAVDAVRRLSQSPDLTQRDDINAVFDVLLRSLLKADDLAQVKWTMRDFVHQVSGPDAPYWWFRYNDREMIKRMVIALELPNPYPKDGDYRSRYIHVEKP